MRSAEKLIFFVDFFLCMSNHGYIRRNLSHIIQKIQNIKHLICKLSFSLYNISQI